MQFWKRKITKAQSRDTGMAMVLLLLILYAFQRQGGLVAAAIVLHVLNMTVPQIYGPVAVIWLGLSHALGMIMSKLLLAVVFYAVVTPIGIVRKTIGNDSLKLRVFKASSDSVMVERNHLFTPLDLERPY